MTDVTTLLAGIKTLEEAATEGPWEVEEYVDIDEDGSFDLAHVIAPDPNPAAVSGVAMGILRNDAAFIAAARTDVPRLVAAIEAVAKVHEPVDALMNPGRHERVVKVCTGCGTDDGNWQRWPCPTITAITTTLGGGE